MRILCVDDDTAAREIYSLGLKKALPDDYTEVAESGEEALEKMKESTFDVVITDLMMPGLDGLEVLAEIREEYPMVEVIMVTGGPSVETAVDAMRKGARDYMEKPINISLLAEKMENVRDYLGRMHETEDLLLAKETTEQHAGLELHELETMLQQYEDKANEALDALQDDTPAEERIKKATAILQQMTDDL
jgi:DNA-binding NtrC family response regulator